MGVRIPANISHRSEGPSHPQSRVDNDFRIADKLTRVRAAHSMLFSVAVSCVLTLVAMHLSLAVALCEASTNHARDDILRPSVLPSQFRLPTRPTDNSILNTQTIAAVIGIVVRRPPSKQTNKQTNIQTNERTNE